MHTCSDMHLSTTLSLTSSTVNKLFVYPYGRVRFPRQASLLILELRVIAEDVDKLALTPHSRRFEPTFMIPVSTARTICSSALSEAPRVVCGIEAGIHGGGS